jgi:hypothetical protein
MKNRSVNSNSKQAIIEAIKKDGLSLQFATRQQRKDKDLVMTAIMQNTAALQFAHKSLRGDAEIASCALQENAASCFNFIDQKLLKDVQFILDNLRCDFYNFIGETDILITLFNSREKVELLLSQNPEFFGNIGKEYRNDVQLFIYSLRVYNDNYGFGEDFLDIHGMYFSDNEEAMKACYTMFPKKTFAMLSSRLKNSADFILDLFSHNVEQSFLDALPHTLKNNQEFLLSAVKVNKEVFLMIFSSFERNVTFLQDCLFKNPWLILEINDLNLMPHYTKLRQEVLDRYLVLYMVAIDGMLLEELVEFNDDEEVVYIALRNNGLALEFADCKYKSNINMIKWAMNENPQALWLIDSFLHHHPELRP